MFAISKIESMRWLNLIFTLCIAAGFATAQETTAQFDYGVDKHAKAGYFTFSDRYGYVFGANVVENGDIYFHMSAPVRNAWIGAGIGSQMAGSFILVAYPAANGLNTTISPRIGYGHTEPTYDPSIQIDKIYNDPYAPAANTVTQNGTGTIIAHAVCRNCSRWANGFLDTTSTQQPFFFAMGPEKVIKSDDPAHSIMRHDFYGHYTMDMTAATNETGVYGRVPGPNVPNWVFPPGDIAFESNNTSPEFDVATLGNPMPGWHGALMIITFVGIFPLGTIILFLFKRVLWHAAIQGIGFVVACAGLAIAVSVSKEYTKSKHYTSGHQLLGLLVFAALCVQVGLGLFNHVIPTKNKKNGPLVRVHIILGPTIIILAIINGGIGFNFANNSHWNLAYGVAVLGVALATLFVFGCGTLIRRKRRYEPEVIDPMFAGQSENYSDYEMAQHIGYGAEPPEPYEATTSYDPTTQHVPTPIDPVPWTPMSAYTPDTPKTFKKEEITNYANKPQFF